MERKLMRAIYPTIRIDAKYTYDNIGRDLNRSITGFFFHNCSREKVILEFKRVLNALDTHEPNKLILYSNSDSEYAGAFCISNIGLSLTGLLDNSVSYLFSINLNMFSILYNAWPMIEDTIVEYIDLDFTLWLSWLLMPLLITFLLPLVIVLLLYLTSLILYVYKLHRVRLRNAYGTDWRNAARYVVAAVWDAHGWIWHGYEVVGLENVPQDRPVLFVYYHGAIPVDLYYFISKVFLFNSKLVHTVADRFLFKIPGWSIISDVLRVIPGTIQTCSTILKEGNMLAISPGGVYEAQFGDSYYRLMWKKRVGFAKVALDAKVSIVPLFTKNVREAFRTVNWGRRIWLKIYTWTNFPLAPVYGGFPVKLVTYVGKPIPYDGNLIPEELQLKVADALRDLINEHQRIPGNISWALVERICKIKRVCDTNKRSIDNNVL